MPQKLVINTLTGIAELVDLTPEELQQAALDASISADNDVVEAAYQVQRQADNTDLAQVALDQIQTMLTQITNERALIATRKSDLQTSLDSLPATLTNAQVRGAIVQLANTDIDIATALDNIDARLIKILRASAILVKRSGN